MAPERHADSGRDSGDDDWWNSPAGITGITAASRAVGAFAFPDLRSRDAALQHAGLPAGAYTAHVTGAAAGTVLAEIYEAPGVQSASGPDAPRLVNVSARSLVSHGDRILIAGFALGGTGSQTLLIRAVGPGLRRLGVSDALEDPKLELYRGPTLLAANDDWASDTVVRAAADSVGAFPLQGDSSKDAALLVTLGAGAYTVQVAAADGGTGTALVELYEVR